MLYCASRLHCKYRKTFKALTHQTVIAECHAVDAEQKLSSAVV